MIAIDAVAAVAAMGGQNNSADTRCKKLHPFFSTNSNSKDSMSNAVTPVTPESSCSLNSTDTADTVDAIDNDTDQSPPPTKLKRKRSQANDAQDTHALVSTSKAPKVLKLNRATGTIGSPPKSKSATKKIAKRGRKPKTSLVSIRYGQDDDASRLRIGHEINEMLANNSAQAVMTAQSKKSPHVRPDTPPASRDSEAAPKKATHPFFQAKPKVIPVEQKQKPEGRVFFSAASNSSRISRPAPSRLDIPVPGVKLHRLKVPGAQHAAWPSKETVHVRGNMPPNYHSAGDEGDGYLQNKRKAKGQQVQIPESESILRQTVSKLNLKQLKGDLKVRDDEFQPPPRVLRVPGRHFESGKKLQARVSGELETLHRHGNTPKTHPAVAHAYGSIEKNLSAFDRATCEMSAWTQKYAPSSAERVLQSGREAELLRDWLENLKVLAVDTGTADSTAKLKAAAPAKGKGKRRKRLDGFVVSSDEEGTELDDISDLEGDWSSSGGQSNTKKTVIRSSSRRASRDGGRFANAVVLSGPHGCGKTATVYAIAKELEFEVFEINSGSRRNGKDILDRVGDMTRNHLVHHRHKGDTPQEEDTPEDEVDRDLKSGKQGTMTSFFKPKAAAPNAHTPTSTPTPTREPADSSSAKEARKSPKAQKQSLILLEEVDVLYEEDKQFWATIISMVAQSKRPFVMTCNDEALLPLQSINLHGIFRFSSPPKDLAVDLLLLIAANEGHALRRRAIETLYDSRGHDFRASITELNYWCQIGVGDERGGFNWFYPRWPRGSDVDEDGNTVRVISQDTYRGGMGWLSRDSAIDGSSSHSPEEELHHQVYQYWSLDTLDSGPEDEYSAGAVAAVDRCSSAQERLDLLESFESYACFTSDADLNLTDFSVIPNKISLDPSVPSLPAKAKDDFIIGRQLIEASPAVHYDLARFDIASSLRHLGRRQLQGGRAIQDGSGLFKPLNETGVTDWLKDHLGRRLGAEQAIARTDYSLAFDPIAASEKTMAAGYLDPSVFDGTMRSICLDVAPYVRSIISYDQRLQQQRASRSSLLSEGGQPGKKRMRTTRSAYSALEGGSRASTRRERYFSADVNPYLVMRTGGLGWDAIVASATD